LSGGSRAFAAVLVFLLSYPFDPEAANNFHQSVFSLPHGYDLGGERIELANLAGANIGEPYADQTAPDEDETDDVD
jgi:hypothetical protein